MCLAYLECYIQLLIKKLIMIKIPTIDSHTHINSHNAKEIPTILNRAK